MGGIGLWRERLQWRYGLDELLVRFTRINEDRRSIGHDHIGCVSAAGADVMNVEISRCPGRQRRLDCLGIRDYREQ